jgi:outer membrane murein-binding lipoprotein Lpp
MSKIEKWMAGTLLALAFALVAGCGDETSDDLTALEARVDALEAENAELRTDGDACSADIGALESDVATLDSELGALESDVATLDTEVVRKIDTVTVLSVPGDHATIQEALEWLDAYRINTIVTIEVADGTYTSDETIWIRHRDGRNVRIFGNTENPGNVVLEYTGSGVGVLVSDGVFGWLAGVTIQGSTEAYGVFVDNNAFLRFEDAVVEDFQNGVYATRGGTVQVGRVTSQDNSFTGFLATSSGKIWASSASATLNDQYGFRATDQSLIVATQSQAMGNSYGYYADSGSIIDAHSSTASGNTTADWSPEVVTDYPGTIYKPE